MMRGCGYRTCGAVFAAFFATGSIGNGAVVPGCDPYVSGAERPVDIVLCLDTSGSMTGLIDSARARLWDIVNTFAGAYPPVQLRVGLLTYGSPHVSSVANGWIVWQSNLTTDLDTVYARLMSLGTNGGEEYVGWVLHGAVNTMSWSPDPQALKMIFVAGNESADQASHRMNFRYIAEHARILGMTIHAIYCGNHQQGIREAWDQVAAHGGGSYSAIDMNRAVIQVPTPYDKILLELSTKLNATYVPYGSGGLERFQQQARIDQAAQGIGLESAASRAIAKATPLYRNAEWDLVDLSAQAEFKWEELEEESLSPAMRNMSVAQRQAHVESRRHSRADLQREIGQVSKKRKAFLKEAKARSSGNAAGLDDAMLRAIRQEADKKGINLK